VIYTEETPVEFEGPFLKEERDLIRTLTETIVVYFNKASQQRELAKSEANMRSIFNNTHASFLLLDEQINIVTYNEYFRKGYAAQTGLELEQGVNFLELRLPYKREALKKVFKAVKESCKPVEYETLYTNTGEPKYFSVTVSPVLNRGSVIGFCLVGFDITNRKHLENEKKKIVADLFNRNRDLQEFAQIVSHNLRGPLATLLGLNNMLKSELTEEEKELALEGIGVYSNKLDAVVIELNNILDVKQESQETSGMVNLNSLLEEIRQKFSDLIAKSGTEIESDFTACNELLTTRSYLHNILYTLVSNSLKYRDEKKPPQIKIWTERKPRELLL
jgi:PAS domain S-box-containing protein